LIDRRPAAGRPPAGPAAVEPLLEAVGERRVLDLVPGGAPGAGDGGGAPPSGPVHPGAARTRVPVGARPLADPNPPPPPHQAPPRGRVGAVRDPQRGVVGPPARARRRRERGRVAGSGPRRGGGAGGMPLGHDPAFRGLSGARLGFLVLATAVARVLRWRAR